MANHKRGRCKRSVRCTMCTQHRWKGNSAKAFRFKFRDNEEPRGKLHQAAVFDDLVGD